MFYFDKTKLLIFSLLQQNFIVKNPIVIILRESNIKLEFL